MKIRDRIRKRKIQKLADLYREVFNDDMISKFVKMQVDQQMKIVADQRAKENKDSIMQKYLFLGNKINKGEPLKEAEQDYYDFAKFLIKEYWPQQKEKSTDEK